MAETHSNIIYPVEVGGIGPGVVFDVNIVSVDPGVVFNVNVASVDPGVVFDTNITGVDPGVIIDVNLETVDASIIIPTTPNNTQTLIDSTTTPLAGAASYTSAAWFDVSLYSFVVGTCFANVAGTLNIQFSSDGTNADGEQPITYNASTKQGYVIDVTSRYARLNFVNGAGAQATFRLYMRGRKI